jgi:GNAT superfamily N-acetyltransferase
MISAAESFYAGFGVATRFQVSPHVCPADLDATLADRGYRWHSPMSLQTAPTMAVQALARTDGPRVRLSPTPTTAWFEPWYAGHGHGSHPQLEWEMLDRITQQSAYASAFDGDEVIAVGRAVADTGWAGVFGMATLPAARGRGAARSILAALADWASARGAVGMYLQVERDNDPAVRLYNRNCFTEVCHYHYRTERSSPTARTDTVP